MKTHKTVDGNEMYIADMTTEHLNNQINSLFRNLEIAKASLNENESSTVNSILYKNRTMSKDKAKYLIEQIIDNKLPAYLMEAQLRWISYTEELQKFFERKEQLSTTSILLGYVPCDD